MPICEIVGKAYLLTASRLNMCSAMGGRTCMRRKFAGHFYCSAKAMWKLSWFLQDFGYDSELLNKDGIDDKVLVGLQGIVKISHAIVHGLSLFNFDGFAPAARWEELSPASIRDPLPGSEVA